MPNADAIHGSLLAFRELFLHANMFMKPHFQDVADVVLQFKEHKDVLIKRTVILLIPILASYDTQTFSEKHLHRSMAHLLSQLKKTDKDLGRSRSSLFGAFVNTVAPQRLRLSVTSLLR